MGHFKMIREMEANGQLKNLKHFKLRAECFHDVLVLIDKLSKNLYGYRIERDFLPDVEFEFITNQTSDEILAVLRKQVDSHVMMDTLKPIKEYTGERWHLHGRS